MTQRNSKKNTHKNEISQYGHLPPEEHLELAKDAEISEYDYIDFDHLSEYDYLFPEELAEEGFSEDDF